MGTVLLTSQADSSTSHLFDVVDRVYKKGGASGVATLEEYVTVDLSRFGGLEEEEEEEEETRGRAVAF